MADIRDWGAFLRGRWNWTSGGYEKDFPRGCAFTDRDATVEFDGRGLEIEAKHHDGIGALDYPSTGQLMSLRNDVRLGKKVFVLYGCGACNSPQGVLVLKDHRRTHQPPCDGCDVLLDWRGQDLARRRTQLRRAINWAMGLPLPELPPIPEPSPPAPLPKRERVDAELHAADPPPIPIESWPEVNLPGSGRLPNEYPAS